MFAEKEGGPAFPAQDFRTDEKGIIHAIGIHGMTLRDYMAGQALVGLLSGYNGPNSPFHEHHPSLAENCFKIADAMIAARGDK